MEETRITELFNLIVKMIEQTETQNKKLNDLIECVTAWEQYAWFERTELTWLLETIDILNPELSNDINWFIYDYSCFSEEDKKEWLEITMDWRKYMIHNDDDFLDYLIDEHGE